jgi:hypothetical protein
VVFFTPIIFGDTLQVSPDTDSLISNGYHNNLKMSLSCDLLAINTGSSTPIANTYILFLTKMQKGENVSSILPRLHNENWNHSSLINKDLMNVCIIYHSVLAASDFTPTL